MPNVTKNKSAELSSEYNWEALGEGYGIPHGIAMGHRLIILRGHFRVQNPALLADLCNVSLKEVLDLKKGYEVVKKASKKKKVDIYALTENTMLSEQEVKFVIKYLESQIVA